MSIYIPSRDELEPMQWHVDQWGKGGRIERRIAICASPTVALAAYRCAVEEWPDKEITCRHGMRVLAANKPL